MELAGDVGDRRALRRGVEDIAFTGGERIGAGAQGGRGEGGVDHRLTGEHPAYGDGEFLDGAKNYTLRVPANVPIKNFWSVLVYDSLSRSELQNSQPFPSVSMYTVPKTNDDGTIDIYFGPYCPAGQEKNWIETLPDRGWFPIFRLYSPLEPFFDKSWKLPDIEKVK